MKTFTKEELKALTMESFNALSKEDQIEAQKQGKAFYLADLGIA